MLQFVPVLPIPFCMGNQDLINITEQYEFASTLVNSLLHSTDKLRLNEPDDLAQIFFVYFIELS